MWAFAVNYRFFHHNNTFITTTAMHRLQCVSTSIVMDNGAQEMGSTPYSGTIQDLTFNLFSILADQRLSANALFWITVWITALGHGPSEAIQLHRSVVHGPRAAKHVSSISDRGYWAWLPDLERISSRWWGVCWGVLAARTLGG